MRARDLYVIEPMRSRLVASACQASSIALRTSSTVGRRRSAGKFGPRHAKTCLTGFGWGEPGGGWSSDMLSGTVSALDRCQPAPPGMFAAWSPMNALNARVAARKGRRGRGIAETGCTINTGRAGPRTGTKPVKTVATRHSDMVHLPHEEARAIDMTAACETTGNESCRH